MDLSIIIPVYNVEKYIRPCIESIFKQGLNENDFEVIIVNDGSTDKSMELIDDIINQHKNITVINQENQGLSVARNNGIAAAKGEYILMPDSDDLFIKNSLKPIIEKAVQTKVDLILADYWPMTNSEIESSSLSMPTISNMVFLEKSGKEMFYEYLKPNYYTVWRTLYKTEFLRQKNLSFVPGIYCQDKPFTHEVYLKADKCLVVSWPIYIYRRHSESISYSMSERYGKDYCICINKMWSLSSNSGLSTTLRQKMMDYYPLFQSDLVRHSTQERISWILLAEFEQLMKHCALCIWNHTVGLGTLWRLVSTL